MEGITMGRDGPRSSHGRKALLCQIFNVGYLSNCGQMEPAYSTVFDRVQSFVCGTAIAKAAVRERRRTPQQNGSAKICGSFRGNDSDIYGDRLSVRKIFPVHATNVYVEVEV